MTDKKRVISAVERLKLKYPDAACSLKYKNAFELLIATRLSAQCTDRRVNIVTPELFSCFPDARTLAAADLNTVEELIKTCGLYKTKAKDLIEISKRLTEVYGGTVPDTIDELITLSGVGRKTANLICGDIYKKGAVVTDTHFIRIMNRLGFVSTKNPILVEKTMRELLPENESSDFCHRVVMHGRDTCTARIAKCGECILFDICKKIGVKTNGKL